jgi:hypothetical protein
LRLLDRTEAFAPDPDAAPPAYIGHMPRSHRPLNVVLTPHAARV